MTGHAPQRPFHVSRFAFDLARVFGLVGCANLLTIWCRIFPTWPARFFSTCSLQTKRHGQSLFGHLSKLTNCLRRARTNAFSLRSSASSSVAACGLPFFVINLEVYTNLFAGTCHLFRGGFQRKTVTPATFAEFASGWGCAVVARSTGSGNCLYFRPATFLGIV